MEVDLTILTKAGEVTVLCYSQGCSKTESQLDTLRKKGYEEFNALPISIGSNAEDSKLQFSVQAENVEIPVSVQDLDMKRIKLGSPRALYFKCYSVSGGPALVRLDIKEGGKVVEHEEFEVTCKKREVKSAAEGGEVVEQDHCEVMSEKREVTSAAGGGRAAFIAGGHVGNMTLTGSTDIVGNQTNYHPVKHHHQGDVNSTKSESRIAQNMAENGGKIIQHGGTNTQYIGKQ